MDGYCKSIKLAKLEAKLLEILCNGKTNTWEEIIKYVYGCADKQLFGCVRHVKLRLLNKIKLDIRTVYKQGLMLKNKIYIM